MIKENEYNISNINFDAYYKEDTLPISDSLKKMLDEASLQARDKSIRRNTFAEILFRFRKEKNV